MSLPFHSTYERFPIIHCLSDTTIGREDGHLDYNLLKVSSLSCWKSVYARVSELESLHSELPCKQLHNLPLQNMLNAQSECDKRGLSQRPLPSLGKVS